MVERVPQRDPGLVDDPLAQPVDDERDMDPTNPERSYLLEDDGEEEVHDLGFIVEDHDDRRATLTSGWQRIDDLGVNSKGPIPHEVALRERGAPAEWFATDYHVDNAAAEQEEEDFVESSMLATDPDDPNEQNEFDDHLRGLHGEIATTDIAGHVRGIGAGMGSNVVHDLGSAGYEIQDNPLVQPELNPISGDRISDVARGTRDVDEMGDDEELVALADQAVREMERWGDEG
jgi:hypothetical protein